MTALSEAPTRSWVDDLRARFAPPPKAYATPGDLARRINPKTVQTEALDVIDAALERRRRREDAADDRVSPLKSGK